MASAQPLRTASPFTDHTQGTTPTLSGRPDSALGGVTAPTPPFATLVSDAVATNVAEVLSRVMAIGDVNRAPGTVLEVDRLVAAAVDQSNIANMSLTWHPWF